MLCPVFSYKDVSISFRSRAGLVPVVRNLDLDVRAGEILGLVGRSGSGKSLTASAIAGMLPAGAVCTGDVQLAGRPVAAARRELGRRAPENFASMIFQNPMVSFSPYATIGRQLCDVIVRHRTCTRREAREKANGLLARVLLPDPKGQLAKYPHELSGGQLQRVVIAMAIACQPKGLIADEPTTALDVTVQHQIIDLLGRVAADENLSILFISHNLNVVANLSHRIAVMEQGRLVEVGATETIMTRPQHPYTRALLGATPQFRPAEKTPAPTEGRPLITVQNVSKVYKTGTQAIFANQNITLQIDTGESVGLVGESGSGKSTLGHMILQLSNPTSGELFYKSKNLRQKHTAQLFRQSVGVVFQNPYSSLNPRMRVRDIIAEPLQIAGKTPRATQDQRVCEALQLVDLDDTALLRFPEAFSGGQRQRIAIARALVTRPEFLVLDEPTSALDVSVQDQILQLLIQLQADFRMSYLFISHDLAVVRQLCDRVYIMKQGQIVESGPVENVFSSPQNHYTRHLIEAIPQYSPPQQGPRRSGETQKGQRP